jgi:hypothetical protein
MNPAPTIATSAFGLVVTGFLDVDVSLHNRARPGQVVKRHFCTLGHRGDLFPCGCAAGRHYLDRGSLHTAHAREPPTVRDRDHSAHFLTRLST